MVDYRKDAHTVYDIKYHIVWVTKYRYPILKGSIGDRLRDLLRQGCETMGISVVQGNIRTDHVHMLLSCPPSIAPSKVVQYLKGRSSKLIQDEFPELKKKYWGQHLWARGYFCATVGSITEEMIKEYIANQGKDEEDTFKVTE
ncbi:transposase IS200-family protein [Clostridium sartagoforme AAU1]|uniref:Transposase IS200-family protein n=1 Tax=Clostridium sartagoforme AAU1 TaxID=1202534 RepID=R9C7A8_9CLOT|nr:IS200/IS605 family transposase [Clostridium sartagoforme]EOR25254.1 transposase IS200-family protein [Clostridium sartagoforme AAU1]